MLNGTGFADIPATDVTVVSSVQILCSFNLTGAPEGFRTVVVTNNNGNQGVLAGGFRVDGTESLPVVNFVATPGTGIAPLFVRFNDTSADSAGSWEWSFGDGETSNSQNTSHWYAHPGNYRVNFTVNSADGNPHEIKTDYIIVKPPKPAANFTSNVTQIPVNGFVQFSDTSANTPTRWQWTFGDDLFYDTHQNPVHQYLNPGIFSVHLTVTNADGSDSIIKTNYIQVMNVNHAPVLAQITNKTTTIDIPLTFILTASDLDNDRLTYSVGRLPTGATFDPALRTFTWTPVDGMAGNYPITFTVSDGTLNDSETLWITVNAKPSIPPIAQFTLNTTQGQAPLTVQFTDQSVSTGTASYQWDINNDAVVDYTSRNPVHTYQTAGNYTVKLTVTNASGSDSEIKTDYIRVVSTIVASSKTLYLTNFGIKADGSDETAKLQSALTYAKSNGYTAVSFPTGGKTIGISDPIYIPANMEIIGNECTIKLLAMSGIGHWVWTIDTGPGVYIHNLKINGNKDNQQASSDPGYYFPKAPNDGIALRDGARFENNEVYNFGGYMVESVKGDNVVIKNNILHDGWQYAICTAGLDSDYSNNLVVSNNKIYRMGQVGIKIQHTSNSRFEGNTITMPARYDLFSVPSIGSPEPTGIRLYSYDGPNNHLTITGNTIIGTGGNNEIAIESDTSANNYITITNNQIRNAYKGINVKFNNGIITGNTIDYVSTCIANGGSGNTISGNSCST
jgi:PKD repeat protein